MDKKNKNYLVLSDIHGNLSALESVLESVREKDIEGAVLLGDQIDYGMRSNEVLECLQNLPYPILIKLWGNHEHAIMMEDFSRFSSQRGEESARHTAGILTESSKDFLKKFDKGSQQIQIDGKQCLAIHGSLENNYWKSIEPTEADDIYKVYDIVLSGHSHRSYCYTKFYNGGPRELRGQKPVMFVNPGSVGQPRNGNPLAQFAIVDFVTMSVELKAVCYDIKFEQSFFNNQVSPFYKERLSRGV